MVRTSQTDHFFKLAPFWSPLTDLIDFDMAGKLLTSATRRCSPFVDSVSRIWIKPKKSLIGCWAPTATTFGQSAPPRVQLTAGRNGHNRHFERPSLVSSVCRSLCTGKIELYVSWAAYFRGVLPWLQRTTMKPAGFACTGTILLAYARTLTPSHVPQSRSHAHTIQCYCRDRFLFLLSLGWISLSPVFCHSVILLRCNNHKIKKNLASDRQGYFVKRPRKNTLTQQIYA